MLKNIIFDWSGTLADDQQYTYQITNETLVHFGAKPISFDEYIRNFKIPVDQFYSQYIPNYSIKEIDGHFFENYKKHVSGIGLFSKTKLLLEFANEFGLNLYICSTLDQEIIDFASENLGISPYFKKIYGNCFNKIKSMPLIISENKLEKAETIFIGDTAHDMEAAKSAQIQCGAVLYGYSKPNIMLAQNPDEFFNDTTDLYFKITALFDPSYYAKPVATVGGLIFNEKKEVLLIRTDKWSKKWGIPGGKIKYNETMENAFIREIKEETNLDIKDIKLICTQDCIQHPEFYLPRHFLLVNFIANAISNNVRINYEASEYKWVTLNQALQMDLNEPTRTLIKRL